MLGGRLTRLQRRIREAAADRMLAFLMGRTGRGKGRRPFGAEELRLLYRALASQNLFGVGGRMVTALEREFAVAYGVASAVASTSGTAAIHVALGALDLDPGAEIITAPITDLGTIIPMLYQGAVPVFADVDASYNMDPADIERKITDDTRAIIAVHLFGNPCDMDAIMRIGRRLGIPVIEDCSQAHMTRFKGRLLGTIGDIGTFSFQQSKQMTTGDGGMTITSNPAYAERMRFFVDKGYARRGWGPRAYLFHAPNYRMNELTAAVGLAQLKKVRGVVERRMALGAYMSELLSAIPNVVPAPVTPGAEHAYWAYPFGLRGAGAEQLAKTLAAERIPVLLGYTGKPIYLCSESLAAKKTFGTSQWPFTAKPGRIYEYREGLCPKAEALLRDLICVMWDESWTKREVARVAELVRRSLEGSVATPPAAPEVRPAVPRLGAVNGRHRPVRIGIIGCGQIGRWHLDAYSRDPRVSVVAVADTVRERAETFARETGARAYATHRALLGNEVLEGASICTVPATHREIALDCLRAGVHVLCEKPLAVSLSEAQEIVAEAAKANRLVLTAFKFRFHDEVRQAKALLEKHALGRILSFRVMFGGALDVEGSWHTRRALSGGGVIMDNGPHAVDLLRFLFGEIDSVSAEAGPGRDVEETAQLQVGVRGGPMGVVDLSWQTGVPSPAYLEIYGEQGTLQLDLDGLSVRYREWTRWKRVANRVDVKEAFARQLVHFSDAILGRRPETVLSQDGLRAQAVIEAAYASLRARARIDVAPTVPT